MSPDPEIPMLYFTGYYPTAAEIAQKNEEVMKKGRARRAAASQDVSDKVQYAEPALIDDSSGVWYVLQFAWACLQVWAPLLIVAIVAYLIAG